MADEAHRDPAGAAEVWDKLCHAVATGTVLETLVELVLAEIPQVSRLRAERAAAQEEVLTLLQDLIHVQMKLAEADERIADLRAKLEKAKTSAASRAGSGHPLYRRVGLDAQCPEFVAVAARRSYRTKLHPDAHPDHHKAAAHRRFVEAEKIFEQIWLERGFRP